MSFIAKNLSHLMLKINSNWDPPLLIEEENSMIWSVPQIIVLLHYVLRCGLPSPSVTTSRLDFLAMTHQTDTDGGQTFFKAVASLMADELRVFFTVPKLEKSSNKDNLKTSEILAAFIGFLFEVLDCKRDLNFPVDEERFCALRKELRFLAAILGDAPLQCVELHEDVNELLSEIEATVNDAGSLIHSFFFTRDRILKAWSELDASICGLLGSFGHLKTEIKQHCIRFSYLADYINAQKRATLGSVYNIVDALLDDLNSVIETEVNLNDDLKYQLELLGKQLEFTRSSLIKTKEMGLHLQIGELKERIRHMAYEAEHLFGVFMVGDFSSSYLGRRLPNVIWKLIYIRVELEKVNINDTTVVKVREDLSAPISLQVKTGPLDDDITLGFKQDEISIQDELVGGRKQLQIVSIIGMPGLGKTTLAKKLYNDPSIIYHFDKRAWCVVSHAYEIQNVLAEILMGLITTSFDIKEEHLGEQIYRSLKGRRYLLVMDDVWTSDLWGDLKRFFPDDGNGSRIVFTSRNKNAIPCASINHELRLWSSEHCWELLQMKVFHGKHCPSELEDIGKQIAACCFGLPLTVVAIAGILTRLVQKRRTWEKVHQRLASHVFDAPSDFMKVLELSYSHLPDHLKPCFLYFGAFPEDTEIPVQKLTSLWIAEGFIKEDGSKSLDIVAKQYLMELINRSLVLIIKTRSGGGVKSCGVHDLLHDLCLEKS